MKSRWWRGTKARPSLFAFVLNSELEHRWAWDWSYSSPLQLGLVCNRLVDPVIWCVEFNTTDTRRWEDPWLSLASDVSVWSWAVSKRGRSWVSWVHLMFALETVHAYNFLVLVENVVQWAFWRNEFLFTFTADIYLTLLSIKSCLYGASLSKPHAKLVHVHTIKLSLCIDTSVQHEWL